MNGSGSKQVVDMELVRDMYTDVEVKLLSFMKARVSRYRGVDLDEAIQEARIALLNAMTRFDYNRGDLLPYMKEVVTNTYRAEVSKVLAASRCPRIPERNEDGTWGTRPQLPASYEALLEARVPVEGEAPDATDAALLDAEADAAMRRFKQAFMAKLNERERAVLRCRMAPPEALIALAGGDEGDIDNVHIAAYLGMNKAQIDWALYKIRNIFTELAESDKWADMWAGSTRGKGWPHIHASKGTKRHNRFIERTLESRGLDAAAITVPAATERCALGTRTVEQYEWGAIMIVQRPGEVWTLVCEGALNPRSGEVTGASGARKLVPIDGYAALAKALGAKG
jgi:RNA polymerase sigma factor (sigma-70 family)